MRLGRAAGGVDGERGSDCLSDILFLISKQSNRRPRSSANLKRELGLLGCEKGREEGSGPRSRSWI
jgi:hypothetical protein